MPISSVLGSSALLPGGLGFRNLLVNGGFDVWQRGTSFTPSANTAVYTADRFVIFRSVSGNHTSTRVASDLNGFNYFNRLGRATSDTATGALYAGASLETSTMVVPMQGKQAVFSFYARKGAGYSATNSQLILYFEYGSGTDTGFLTNLTTQVSQTFTLTSNWQRFYFVLPVIPSSTTAARYFFQYIPTGTATSTDYWDITGLQLEVNYQATPFEQRPIGVELALCQRYYWRSWGVSTGYARIASCGSTYGGAAWAGYVTNPVPMRVAATSIDANGISCTDNIGYDGTAFSSVALGSAIQNNYVTQLSCTGGGGIVNISGGQVLILRGGTTAYFGASAEL